MPEATWEPREKHGRLTESDVSDEERDMAFANIQKAARRYGVNLSERSWHDLSIHR